jgi:hypothetical protein
VLPRNKIDSISDVSMYVMPSFVLLGNGLDTSSSL